MKRSCVVDLFGRETMKTIASSVLFLFLAEPGLGQHIPPDSLYLGQPPPGDSAVLFAPALISSPGQFENALTFSPEGTECCYEIFDGVSWGWGTILYARYDHERWSGFQEAQFIDSKKFFDILPFFSPDGQKFLFSSARPSHTYSQVDLYLCRRSGRSWEAPVKLDSSINDPAVDESYSSMSTNGTIYFNKDNTRAIWMSAWTGDGYSKATKVPEPVNSEYGASAPFIAPDESYIIFSSSRPEGFGDIDLYISYRKRDGGWTNPQNLGPGINSPDREAAARVSPDGKYLFFSRSKVRFSCHIYWVSASFIERLRKN